MKLWVDDVRPAPDGYVWAKSVNIAKQYIELHLQDMWEQWYIDGIPKDKIIGIELIDIDHDAGDYANDGGDYIKLLDWLEEKGWSYPIHIHSMNPVGVENMRRIIERNGWKEVK